jgi:hypothetical protein
MQATDADTAAARRPDRTPAGPTKLSRGSWGGALKRTLKELARIVQQACDATGGRGDGVLSVSGRRSGR